MLKNISLMLIVLLGLASPSISDDKKPQIMTSSALANFAMPEPDHKISYGAGALQYGELRLPKNAKGPLPTVFFIHGGCWLSDYDIKHSRALTQAMADAGYAVWSVEYRRVGDAGGGWPGSFNDIAAAGDYLRTLAPKYNLDLNKVIASGHSAGGHLALWYTNRPANFKRIKSVTPKAVLALAPAPDLKYLHKKKVCGHVINGLMGGSPSEYPARYAQGDGIARLVSKTPQTIFMGKFDSAWSPIGQRYVDALKVKGIKHRQVIAPLSGHFEMIDPTSSTWPLVLNELNKLIE